MFRIILEDFRPCRPHFVHLRRVLDEVTRHARSTEARIFYVRKHPVQGMAELMESSAHLIVREQRWFARRRLRNIEMIGNDRLGPEQIALLHVRVHPCAAAFRWTRVIVAKEQRQRLAIAIVDFEYAHVRLINGNVMPLLEGETVKFSGGEEYTVENDVIQLVIWTQLRLVEGVTRLANFLRIKGPIP